MLTAGPAIKKNSYEQPADVSLVMEALAGRSIHPSSASLLPSFPSSLPLQDLPFNRALATKLIRKTGRSIIEI